MPNDQQVLVMIDEHGSRLNAIEAVINQHAKMNNELIQQLANCIKKVADLEAKIKANESIDTKSQEHA